MPTQPPAAVRPRHGARAKRKDPVSSILAARPQTVTPSAQNTEEDISRLRGVMERLQTDRRVSERETGDEFSLTAELRWRINQLEKEKLECTSKHNEQVSQCEAQVTRLRAQVERGEAQRQTLEYDVAVARRDAAAERRNTEEKINQLTKHNHRLEVLSSELRQRVSDLQRSLEITQRAREDDLQGLQAELRERDRLLLTANAEIDRLQDEKSPLEALIQEQNDTLHQLKCEMERMKRDGEKDSEKLKRKSTELSRSTEREEKLRSDLEAALQKVKVLEQSVESERTAHLQSKFSSEIIQMRMRDLEDALEVEKNTHAEVSSSLEVWKQKCVEVEKSVAHEREKSHHMSLNVTQLEKDLLTMKTDLTAQLEKEKAASAELIGQLEQEKVESEQLSIKLQEQERVESEQLSIKLQEQERVWSERQQEVQEALVCVQQSYDGLLSEIDQVVQQYQQQGAAHTYSTGQGGICNPLDVLRQTLHHYSTQLQESVIVMQKINHENKLKDETVTELQRNIQECEARGVCANEELKRLRVCVADAATDLRRLTQQLQEEKTQHAHTHAQMNTLHQRHHSEDQEKLMFLHTLYQRLIAGCVLVTPPHCMLGSFSWAELSAVVQEHVDTLTSDLSAANQKVSYLEKVCEGKSAALESVRTQLRQREESWGKQREDLNTQHTHTNNHLQMKIQDVSRQLEQAEGRVLSLERAQSEQEQEGMRLQGIVSASDQQKVCLLAACGLLAGCVRGLRQQVCLLAMQKAMLQERVCDAQILRSEVSKLLRALAGGEVRGHAVHRFRVCVMAVLALGRLRALGRRSAVMFRVPLRFRTQTLVCVNELKTREEEEEKNSRVMKTLSDSELLALIHSSMEEVQQEMKRSGGVKDSGLASAAQIGCRKLLERLLIDVDSSCAGHYGKDSLSQRLGDGLHALTTNLSTEHNYCNSEVMVASLQKHILQFTQRLHSAEVERRNLRLEISRIRRTNTCDDTHNVCVPLQQFESVCEDLSSALQRELRAQALLHDQASQLQQLGLSMELHTGDQMEKDRTLAQAVQSLSDAKQELRRKEQSVRSLGKQLSQSQQENRRLQQDISSTAKNEEALMSYMKSVEECLKEMKERVILRQKSSRPADFTLQLSRITLTPPDSQSIMGNPEMDACQRLVLCFCELNQLLFSIICCQERRICSYESLNTPLQESSLRDKHCTHTSPSAEVDCGSSDALRG